MLIAVGSRRYGKSGMRPDGSFVTMEWFHICFFPIYPLRQIRVKPQFGRELIEELPRSPSGILKTYGFALAYIGWFGGVMWFTFARNSSYLNSDLGLWIAFVSVAVAMTLPFGLLWLARREAFRAYHRKTD